MEKLIIEYAPLIVVVIAILLKNRLFVTPEQMQKERQSLIEEVERRFLELVAFREYEKRMNVCVYRRFS